MIGDTRNLKISDLELRHRLPARECDWLIRQLLIRRGIAAAQCAPDARHVTVEYDADELVTGDVVEFLGVCGVSVVAVHVARL